MKAAQFKCSVCGRTFSLSSQVLDKYPAWKPRYCKQHSPKSKKSVTPPPRATEPNADSEEHSLTPAQVLEHFSAGPQTGVFTDGSARPNPGPGGWGMVFVRDGSIIKQEYGHEEHTTNNRMELIALIHAYRALKEDEAIDVFSDSELCVKIINQWAPGWERQGWKRKGGPIKNLELVKELYALHKSHPKVKLQWIESHNGWLWNEYADALASAWTRERL